jgi:Uncharacterized protein conserved in bacteria
MRVNKIHPHLFFVMNIEELRDFCLSLPHAEESMPFDNETLVFKVGGKMFLMSNLDQPFSFTIKSKPEDVLDRIEHYADTFDAYHISKKHWITIKTAFSNDDERLKRWIIESYDIVVSGLTKKNKSRTWNLTFKAISCAETSSTLSQPQ